jgi:hypothetical protein
MNKETRITEDKPIMFCLKLEDKLCIFDECPAFDKCLDAEVKKAWGKWKETHK